MMTSNGLTFGSEGPIMEGTWYNTQTGDSFTVRNSFFEDNQYIVQTTDGRVLNYEQIQHYIKSDKPIEVKKPTPKAEELPAEVADLIEDNYDIMEDDWNMINNQSVSLGNLNDKRIDTTQQITNPIQVVQSSPKNLNYDIISKALSKRDLPDFQVGVDWLNCPVKEIGMLVDLMDVQESEIIDWYLDQVDVESTTIMIKEVIKDYLLKQLSPQEELLEEPTPTKEEKPKKTKTKTTKKK